MSRWQKIIIALLLLLLGLELLFDIFEIAIGMVMLATNDYRPKVGRLWNEEAKDEIGQTKVNMLLDSLAQISTVHRKIRNLQDLTDYLAYKSKLVISRDEFIALYQAFSEEEAGRLLDPALLYDMTQNNSWQSIRLSYADDKISLLFLDAYGQPLLDATAFVGDLSHFDGRGQLQNDPMFQGRIVDGSLFSLAYESLDKNLQLQIINDPRLYAQWRGRLLQVGIAPQVEFGSVSVAFEVIVGAGTEITKLQSSELAIGYLIQAINQLAPKGQTISEPVREE